MGIFNLGGIASAFSTSVTGGSGTPWWQTALKGVGEGLSAYAKSAYGDQPSVYSSATTPAFVAKKKDNTILFVIIGGVAIVGFVIVLMAEGT